MANVADRRTDPMDNFFKGIATLQQGAQTLTQFNMLNKELDLKKEIANQEYLVKKQNVADDSLKTQAYAQSVAAAFGSGKPSDEFLIKSGIDPSTWKQMTKEERQAWRNKETSDVKHAAKLEEIDAESRWKIIEEGLRQTNMTDREIKKIKAEFAVKNVSPGKAAMGAAAAEEILTPQDQVIQPFEELLSVPGLFGKKITAVDLVNKIGTKKLNEVDPRINMAPIDYLRKLNAAIKDSPKDKKVFLQKFYKLYPEFESVMK